MSRFAFRIRRAKRLIATDGYFFLEAFFLPPFFAVFFLPVFLAMVILLSCSNGAL